MALFAGANLCGTLHAGATSATTQQVQLDNYPEKPKINQRQENETSNNRENGGESDWYKRGIWPLAGAIGAILLGNAVTIAVVYIQSAKSFEAVLRQRKIDFLASSLNEFYNPLLALIEINGEIFSKTGPPSFPEDEIERDAAGLVWKETKKKIIANNLQIETILKERTHLIFNSDSLDAYKGLLVHVAMYETFQTFETDLYKDFLFPKDIHAHIIEKRQATLEAFRALTGEQA